MLTAAPLRCCFTAYLAKAYQVETHLTAEPVALYLVYTLTDDCQLLKDFNRRLCDLSNRNDVIKLQFIQCTN